MSWKNSGESIELVIGQYTVTFKDVDGWDTPASQLVTIENNVTAEITANYIRHVGSLSVGIESEAARTDGAQWRRVGETTWLDHGHTESSLPTGDYEVEFKEVSNWYTPINQTITVVKDQIATGTGTYLPHAGSLTITMSPSEATIDGAKWRRVGTSTWNDSGFTETDITVGTYTVEFNTLTDWVSPATISVDITKDLETTDSGAYVRKTGSLTGNIEAADARAAGGQWRRVGETTWNDHGFTETGIPTGTYDVEFKEIANWGTPATQSITVLYNDTVTVTGTYIETGILSVSLTPEGAVTDGAQWDIE